ncbi:hypothetical protein HYW43_00380, partial [Candidatus Daviesbacteria bacterium]|nr:hypothetical protein [Candidatus Daviesbacteria bacterium]
HFGAELTDETRQSLILGEKITQFLDQSYSLTLPADVEVVLFGLIWAGFLGDDPKLSVSQCRLNLASKYSHLGIQKLLSEVTKAEDLDGLIANVIKKRADLMKLCQQNQD